MRSALEPPARYRDMQAYNLQAPAYEFRHVKNKLHFGVVLCAIMYNNNKKKKKTV